jgi:hypothetical protein
VVWEKVTPEIRANVIVARKRDIRRILSPDAELIEGRHCEWLAGGGSFFSNQPAQIKDRQSHDQNGKSDGENMMPIIFNTLSDAGPMIKQLRDIHKYGFL